MYSSLISLIYTDARRRWRRCFSLFILYIFMFLSQQILRTSRSASICQAVSQNEPRWPFTHLQLLHKGCVCRKLARTHYLNSFTGRGMHFCDFKTEHWGFYMPNMKPSVTRLSPKIKLHHKKWDWNKEKQEFTPLPAFLLNLLTAFN